MISKSTLLLSSILISFAVANVDNTNDLICKDEDVLIEIKTYLEHPNIQSIFQWSSVVALGLTPNIIWEHLIRLDSICDSKEAEILKYFCNFPILHGSRAYYYCFRTNEITTDCPLHPFLYLFAILRSTFPDLCQNLSYVETSAKDVSFPEMDTVAKKYLTMPSELDPPKHEMKLLIPVIPKLTSAPTPTEKDVVLKQNDDKFDILGRKMEAIGDKIDILIKILGKEGNHVNDPSPKETEGNTVEDPQLKGEL